jgi:hypothetical protein
MKTLLEIFYPETSETMKPYQKRIDSAERNQQLTQLAHDYPSYLDDYNKRKGTSKGALTLNGFLNKHIKKWMKKKYRQDR